MPFASGRGRAGKGGQGRQGDQPAANAALLPAAARTAALKPVHEAVPQAVPGDGQHQALSVHDNEDSYRDNGVSASTLASAPAA